VFQRLLQPSGVFLRHHIRRFAVSTRNPATSSASVDKATEHAGANNGAATTSVIWGAALFRGDDWDRDFFALLRCCVARGADRAVPAELFQRG
jgi:hypothetical protein